MARARYWQHETTETEPVMSAEELGQAALAELLYSPKNSIRIDIHNFAPGQCVKLAKKRLPSLLASLYHNGLSSFGYGFNPSSFRKDRETAQNVKDEQAAAVAWMRETYRGIRDAEFGKRAVNTSHGNEYDDEDSFTQSPGRKFNVLPSVLSRKHQGGRARDPNPFWKAENARRYCKGKWRGTLQLRWELEPREAKSPGLAVNGREVEPAPPLPTKLPRPKRTPEEIRSQIERVTLSEPYVPEEETPSLPPDPLEILDFDDAAEE